MDHSVMKCFSDKIGKAYPSEHDLLDKSADIRKHQAGVVRKNTEFTNHKNDNNNNNAAKHSKESTQGYTYGGGFLALPQY